MLPRIARRTHDDGECATWFCPGCACDHEVPIGFGSARWLFEGTDEEPTLKPTVIVTRKRGAEVLSTCHARIRKGEIEFLQTSTHALSGQTVPMEPA